MKKANMKCPKCGATMNAAALLGSLSKGKAKTLTKAEIARRTARLNAVRKLRWPEKTGATPAV